MDSSWLIPITDLPDLKPAALDRIRTAQEQAAQLLVQETDAAWQNFHIEPFTGSGTVALGARLNALHSAHQNATRAIVKFALAIVDAIATEYSVVDGDEQSFLDRIHVIIPAVLGTMPVQDTKSTVSIAILARTAHWGRLVSQPERPTWERRGPGRPGFPEERCRDHAKPFSIWSRTIHAAVAHSSIAWSTLLGTASPPTRRILNYAGIPLPSR
jgi:hypothetical protein